MFQLRRRIAVRMHGAVSGSRGSPGMGRLGGLALGLALLAVGAQARAQSANFDQSSYFGQVGTPFPVTLETRDGNGLPIGGGTLVWDLSACTSNPSFASPPPASADASGSTTATVLFSAAEYCQISATWDPDGTGPGQPLPPALAYLDVSPPPLQATPLVPLSQVLDPFAASPELRVQVTDGGSPYPGARVQWLVYAPGQATPSFSQGSTCGDTPFNTNAQGIATLDLGPSGINRPLDALGSWSVELRAFRPGEDFTCPTPKAPSTPKGLILGASLTLSVTVEDVTIAFQNPPAQIASGQSATFTVQLTGQQSGNPVQGAPVTFTAAPSTSLSPSSGSQNTDANGLASFTVTAGATPTSSASVGASVNLPLQQPTTRSTSTTAAVSALSLTLDTPAPTGPTFTEETAAGFSVRADQDQGNGPIPVSGVPVTFTVLSGPGSFAGGQTSVVVNTDTSGIAASPALEVGRGNGPVVVEANGGPYGSLTQNYAVQPSTYTLAPSNTPTSITATQGQPVNLAVLLERAGSSTPVPLPGETVTWQISPSDGSTIAPQPATTDNAGISQVSFTPADAVVYTVTALFPTGLGNDPSVSFTVNATTSSTFVLDAFEGNGQQGLVLQPGTPLGARLRIDGQPAPAGVRVDWRVQQGDVQLDASQSRTDADGVARMGFRFGATPGESLVLATSVFGTSTVFRVVATDQATLVIVSGDGQRAAPGTRLPEDFVVEARSASGGVLNGVQVFWSVRSGDGQLDAAQTTTDASGQARNRFTLGSTPGTAQVTAALATGQEVVFTATAATGTGTGRNLSIVRGDLQRGLVFTMADLPLEVRYADALGAPIAGATIEWEVQGDASLSATTTTTDMQGLARVDLTFGATPGPVQVIASAPGNGAMVSFSLASRLPLVVNVVGNDQSGPVGKPLPQPLGLDLDLPPNKALSGVPVQWQVLSGGGALASATTIADAQGRVRNSWTLGGLVGQQTVQATLPGGQQILFRATGTLEGAVGSLRIVSGDQQALPTNAPSAPLVVEVLDTNGAPLADVPIEWEGDPTRVALQSQQTRSGSDGRSSNVATILLPGAVEVSARIADTSLPAVTFRLLGGVARIPGLDDEERDVGTAIDNACPALFAMSNRTPEQEDLLARCSEMVVGAGPRPQEVRGALDQLPSRLGESMADQGTGSVQTQFDNLDLRLHMIRGEKGGAQRNQFSIGLWTPDGTLPLSFLPSALLAAGEGEPEAGLDFDRWGFFATGQIGRGRFEEGSRSPRFEYDIAGLTFGVDYRFSDRFVAGLALGYSDNDAELAQRGGEVATRGWNLSAYGTWYASASWYIDGTLMAGRLDYDLKRRLRYLITALDGGQTVVDQVASASTKGDVLGATLSVGRDWQKGPWSLGAYFRGQYSRIETDAFVERMIAGLPGEGLALAIDARTTRSVTTVLGGRATYILSRDWGILMPSLSVEWEHEFEDDPGQVSARFAFDPSQTRFVRTGDPLDSDYFNVGIGVSAVFPGGRSAYLYYEELVGASRQRQGLLSLGVRMEF